MNSVGDRRKSAAKAALTERKMESRSLKKTCCGRLSISVRYRCPIYCEEKASVASPKNDVAPSATAELQISDSISVPAKSSDGRVNFLNERFFKAEDRIPEIQKKSEA